MTMPASRYSLGVFRTCMFFEQSAKIFHVLVAADCSDFTDLRWRHRQHIHRSSYTHIGDKISEGHTHFFFKQLTEVTRMQMNMSSYLLQINILRQ